MTQLRQLFLHDHVGVGRKCREFLPIPRGAWFAARQGGYRPNAAQDLHNFNCCSEHETLHNPILLETQYPNYLDGAESGSPTISRE